MISKLCADARVWREGLQQLQREIQLLSDEFQRDGNGPADVLATLLSLSAASTHASVAESSVRGTMDALTRAAASFPHQPPNDIAASSAVAPAAAEASSEAAPNAESSVVEGKVLSFRLVCKSGRPPPNNGPARFRLSRDELAGVFGFYQPWELARVAPTIGKTLVGWAAQQYTHLTIDGSDKGGVRRLWERLPLEVAYRWGQRAANLTHLHVIYACWEASYWCRGIWVAILEGNAVGQEGHEGEEGGGAGRGRNLGSSSGGVKAGRPIRRLIHQGPQLRERQRRRAVS
ncbi:unnamed protein product [Vitrella brassicaformis CCMP3155]|uniref:Uncharacterized protein n=1 Tax=Vitrella brassicaformis (strain CCMP3155) TaxID=1169540 RepID=A0A0G4F2C2_VITBC|nr:unnamed protein product [Vitrella brassicaformis CCMP3155]|eukprot:CEM05781.1 unnamed protein product [Vitrella brassicaformis CCMP3155]